MKILHVDEHRLSHEALAAALPQHEMAHADSVAAALSRTGDEQFDLTIFDLCLPQILQSSRFEELCFHTGFGKMAILSSEYFPVYASQRFRKCLVGYWPKTIKLDRLSELIDGTEKGERVFCPASDWGVQNEGRYADSLSDLEVSAVRLLALGYSSKETAKELGLELALFNEILRALYRKMSVTNRVAACVKAYESALL